MEIKPSGNAKTTPFGESFSRIDSMWLQSVNTEEPSSVKLLGKITSLSAVHLLNVNLPRVVTVVLDRSTDVSFSLLLNA